jgi:hypothetical protein
MRICCSGHLYDAATLQRNTAGSHLPPLASVFSPKGNHLWHRFTNDLTAQILLLDNFTVFCSNLELLQPDTFLPGLFNPGSAISQTLISHPLHRKRNGLLLCDNPGADPDYLNLRNFSGFCNDLCLSAVLFPQFYTCILQDILQARQGCPRDY